MMFFFFFLGGGACNRQTKTVKASALVVETLDFIEKKYKTMIQLSKHSNNSNIIYC